MLFWFFACNLTETNITIQATEFEKDVCVFSQIHSKWFYSQGITFESNFPLIYNFSWADGLWKRVISFSYCFPESVIQILLCEDRMVHKHFPGGKWLLTAKRSSEQSFCINMFAHQWLTEKSLCVQRMWIFLSETSYLETVFQIDQEGWVMLGSRERNCTGYCFIRMHGWYCKLGPLQEHPMVGRCALTWILSFPNISEL